MLFSEIPGQADVKTTLVEAIKSNHIAHAQLFSGKPGGAALAMALAYATYLNCDNRLENDSCGICPSCQKNKKFIHPDLHFVFPVSSTKKITGDKVISNSFLTEWRKFLEENYYGNIFDWISFFGGESKQANISKEESRNIIKNLSLKALEAKYKIMIIWLPEFMHVTAANAILKILEEPPVGTIFLLVTENRNSLLATILSRVQAITIPPFSDEEVANTLMDRHAANHEKAWQMAHLADGDLNEAVKLLGEVEDNSQAMFRDWMRLCYARDFTKLVLWSDSFQKMNKVEQKTLLLYGLSILRDSLIACYSLDSLIRANGDEKEFLRNFSKVMTPAKVEELSSELNAASYHLERNANPKILFLNLSLIIAKIIRK